MHAIILVGGRGTRLQPLTDTRPKPMLPLLGLPFLEHQLTHLRHCGVDRVTFACGFLPDAIRQYFGDGSEMGMQLTYAIEPVPLDTAGAIAFAARTVEGHERTRFLVCNGDILTSLDVGRLVAEHERRGAVATIALTPVEDPSRYGLVRTDEHGAVTAFVEKPPPEECDTNLINAGTYVLEPAALSLDLVPDGARVNIEREVFPRLVGSGLHALGDDGYWKDIGSFSSYLDANIDLAAGRLPSPAGAARIAPDASIAEDAEVAGDAVLGAGVVVETGASIRRSVVLEGAVIGAGSRLDGVIVGEGARVEAGAAPAPGKVVAPAGAAAASVATGR